MSESTKKCACGGRWAVGEPTKNGLGYRLECSGCGKKRAVTISVALSIVYGSVPLSIIYGGRNVSTKR